MAAKQIIDSLPSYISLYTKDSCSPSVNAPDRTAILRWFSFLSVHQRLSHLTIVDRSFSQLLLLMLSRLHSHCCGTFIVLPDVASSSTPDLPTLCFRRSRCQISRLAEFDDSERLVRDSLRLFSSKEGEGARDCSCSAGWLGTVLFREGFVGDVDRFMDSMDRVSDSSFLGANWAELSSDWVEFKYGERLCQHVRLLHGLCKSRYEIEVTAKLVGKKGNIVDTHVTIAKVSSEIIAQGCHKLFCKHVSKL